MGLFSVGCLLENQQDRTRSVRVPKVMVDICRAQATIPAPRSSPILALAEAQHVGEDLVGVLAKDRGGADCFPLHGCRNSSGEPGIMKRPIPGCSTSSNTGLSVEQRGSSRTISRNDW